MTAIATLAMLHAKARAEILQSNSVLPENITSPLN